MLNRRGHLPTWLLLIEGLALMIVAWYSFFQMGEGLNSQAADIEDMNARLRLDDSSVGPMVLLIVGDSLRQIGGDDVLAKFNSSFEQTSTRIYGESGLSGNLFELIKNHEYVVNGSAGNYVLGLKGVYVRSKSGGNEATRRFDLRVEFNDSQGLSYEKIYK